MLLVTYAGGQTSPRKLRHDQFMTDTEYILVFDRFMVSSL
jgi:hypothetical protein